MTKLMTLFLATLIIALPGAAEKPVAPATKKSKGKRIFFSGHSFFQSAFPESVAAIIIGGNVRNRI